jgi:predicted ATPase
LRPTPTLRREQIKLQVALLTPLMNVKGYAAPETRAAGERARLLINQAEALGEPPDDPLLLFSVLYGFWVASTVGFNADASSNHAANFLALAEKQGTTVPIMVGHRLMGASFLFIGDVAASRKHLDHTLSFYDPTEHRPLATRLGQDVRVSALFWRSWALWSLGFPGAALVDAQCSLKDAREIGQAGTLMFALAATSLTHFLVGDYATANMLSDELILLADEKGTVAWKGWGMMNQGCVLACAAKISNAVQTMSSGVAAWRSTGSTLLVPGYLKNLAEANAELGNLDEAWRGIDEAMAAMEATGERLWEAETNRIAGAIASLSPEPNAAKAEAYFERALAVARQQQAKSWELRAAMSLAGLWRDQGKVQQARELLAPVYGWFTEGFDTRDLKEAKALLEELAA